MHRGQETTSESAYRFEPCTVRAPMAAIARLASNLRLPAVPAGPSMIKVGVVDTGIVLHDDDQDGKPHPWLDGRVEFDSKDEDRLPADGLMLSQTDGHGTLVAGIVLGEAPRASVRIRRAVGDDNEDDKTVAAAITALACEGVKLINLSFSGDVSVELEQPEEIGKAIAALDADVVVVAAAGNTGTTTKVWPAAFDRVIAVGAVERMFLMPTSYTSRGEWVDAYAPGDSLLGPYCHYDETELFPDVVLQAQRYEGWAVGTGTSFAAAVVTGRIADLAIKAGIPADMAAKLLLQESPAIRIDGIERPYVASQATPVMG